MVRERSQYCSRSKWIVGKKRGTGFQNNTLMRGSDFQCVVTGVACRRRMTTGGVCRERILERFGWGKGYPSLGNHSFCVCTTLTCRMRTFGYIEWMRFLHFFQGIAERVKGMDVKETMSKNKLFASVSFKKTTCDK